jgi:uncharacterized protein (TIGR04255 family)
MTTVTPIAGLHAIKSVSFGLEWQEPLQEDLLILLRALHAKVRDRLPRVTQREEIGFKLVISPAPPIQDAPVKPRLAGLTFDALQPYGDPAWSLAFERNFLAVNCHVYSRWNEIWPIAMELLLPFVPVLARECGIAVIGLQYVDQFRATGPNGSFKAEDLWREGSPLLPAHVFQLEDLWHSHHGYFENLTEPTAHRRLNNIDVDVVKADQERLIQITTAHRAFLDQRATDESVLIKDGEGGQLHHHMSELHQTNKRILRKILNDAVCDQINLRED